MSVRLAELLTGLSRLGDLGFGLQAGESLRSSALAAVLGRSLDLPDDDIRAAMYTGLLFHVGCVGYAHETARVFGNEFVVNMAAEQSNLADPRDVAATIVPAVTRGRPPLRRVQLAVTSLTRGKRFGAAYDTASCEVGRDAARRLGLPDGVQHSIYHSAEWWNGGGSPAGLAGEAIPVAARLAMLTGIAVLFDTIGGVEAAVDAVRRRGGGMVDPHLAEHFTGRAAALLGKVNATDPRDLVLEAEPGPVVSVPEWRLVDIAGVFGDLADLKTPYTHGHSREVAALARAAGQGLNLGPDEVADLEVAGLLHDVGRVAVSTTIWEKPDRLSAHEWEQVRLHAYHSERILSGSDQLAPLARLVGTHHERCDGSGYHRGCASTELTMAARVLAVADAYQAMTQQRAHRPALAPEQAEQRLRDDVAGGRLDADAVAAVLAAAGHTTAAVRRELPAGLTNREVEVLRLVAGGCSNKRIAERLAISRRTAEFHVQRIYTKIGTSSRAAAAMFAMEHDLLDGQDR
ncbi:HD domain-containing protein [Haloechinothrix sp. YIM 98757]|uniref:HD domain-containing protein n=1 Tax=Haloechinothrix aidingensis TaxID=2752311 RepID=A0A838AAW0_9PSEU|nr:HD domain-containing phosphohydrolase [Haloechinothrix aidingensis]MBA0126379.1 HD domain-containing protein [Haloechinothrix aidingensis]